MMKPFVVGIAGGTASGKTTAAHLFVERLGARAVLIDHDRYYKSLPPTTRALDYNFDHPSALETERLVADLDRLRAGNAVRVPRYDFAAHRRIEDGDLLEPRPVIVVEGILVLTDEALRARFDAKVYVDCPDDTRLIRRIRRDLKQRGRQVDDVLLQWEQTVSPMHNKFVAPTKALADTVLDGTSDVALLVNALLALVPTFSDGP
jgi:uridine kinase